MCLEKKENQPRDEWKNAEQWCGWRAPAHRGLTQTLVKADQSAENLLAVGVQLLQLVFYQRCILQCALLDQTLSKHYQPINALCVHGDFLLEALQQRKLDGWMNKSQEEFEKTKGTKHNSNSVCYGDGKPMP